MTDPGDPASFDGRRDRLAGAVPYALTVAAVVMAWQVVAQPLMQRAPVEAAIRVAPGSPQVLGRAAEAELAAGRSENAAALAREALLRSPFDVRALRIVGLTEARAGRNRQADDILTLAGNWSLRDDPTHAWLVEYRLRGGDFASSFAHADTLVRRRGDLQPPVFHLFTMAAAAEPKRALPVIAGLLAKRPPWRQAYLSTLAKSTDGLGVAVNLALVLQAGRSPLTDAELQQMYLGLLDKGQVEMVKALRARLNRPAVGAAVTNGSFNDSTEPEPFQWSFVQKAGAVGAVMAGEVNGGDPALRVEYDGYSPAVIIQQRTFLPPSRFRLSAGSKIESGDAAGRLEWTLTCATSGASLISIPAVPASRVPDRAWARTTAEFSVPSGCPSQLLELKGVPLDRRSPMVVWFDNVAISAAGTRVRGAGR